MSRKSSKLIRATGLALIIQLIVADTELDPLIGNQSVECEFGSAGRDYMDGDIGDDCLHGNDGIDWIVGNEGNDLIHGQQGADVL